jgi:hypothetical protein
MHMSQRTAHDSIGGSTHGSTLFKCLTACRIPAGKARRYRSPHEPTGIRSCQTQLQCNPRSWPTECNAACEDTLHSGYGHRLTTNTWQKEHTPEQLTGSYGCRTAVPGTAIEDTDTKFKRSDVAALQSTTTAQVHPVW